MRGARYFTDRFLIRLEGLGLFNNLKIPSFSCYFSEKKIFVAFTRIIFLFFLLFPSREKTGRGCIPSENRCTWNKLFCLYRCQRKSEEGWVKLGGGTVVCFNYKSIVYACDASRCTERWGRGWSSAHSVCIKRDPPRCGVARRSVPETPWNTGARISSPTKTE